MSLDTDRTACLNRMGGTILTSNIKDTHEQDSLSESINGSQESFDGDEVGTAGVQQIPPTMFMPNYLYGPWRNPDDDDNAWCSVVIWLSSGVHGDDDFKLSVSDCGMFLQYTVYWPRVFHNTVDVHWMWLNGVGGTPKLESYHPMIKCFRKFISVMQEIAGERIYQVARIPLRFQCESRFEVYPQKWGNGLCMLYIMLHAPARNPKRAKTRIQFVSLEDSVPASDELRDITTSNVTTKESHSTN